MSTDNHNDFYCKIEIFCFSNILLPGFAKEKCFAIKDDNYYNFREEYDVYAQDFFDYRSVIDCLNIINERFNNIKYQNISTKQCESILIYNKWNLDLKLSMYSNRWMLSCSSRLTNEWKDNLDKFGREQETVTTRVPHYEEYDFCEFISRERVCQLIRNFLDKNDWNGDFDISKSYDYSAKFWKLWIQENKQNKLKETLDLETTFNEIKKDEEYKNESNLENIVNEHIIIDNLDGKDEAFHEEIDGQLNLFDLGLETE